ncbi:mechanosensitive ion channel family protein [Dongia deserti]|uniref:mechanosensitive ion channel family protein n=1 Tax=Dongia deserti TaxID=2268030 RepID=UPI000E65332D|nr:mechanosensitive ion channel domain-containing protein [Dongia deserti]
MRRFLAAFLGILFAAIGWHAAAQDSPATKLANWESTLTRIERALAAESELPPERHTEILRTLKLLGAEARALRSQEQGQTDPLRDQLARLGAPPTEGQPPEDPGITANRTRLSEELTRSQGRVTRAELVIARVQAIQDEMGRREQEMTQRKLAVQGPLPLSLGTWQDALSDTDVIYQKIQPSAMQWWRNLEIAEMGWLAIAIGIGILILAGFLAFPVRRWVLAKWGPVAEMETPSYTHRMIAAVAGTIARILLPSLAIVALYIVFVVTLPQEYDPAFPIFVLASGGGLVLFFVVSGLTIACLSPDLPAWRIIPVPERAAAMLGGRVVTGAGLLFLLSIANNAVSSPTKLHPSDSFASIIALFASIIAVVVLLPCLRAKYWVTDTHFKSRLSWLVRTIASLVIIAALVAALGGYASLATDLLAALSQSTLLIGGALLLREVIGEGIGAFMTPGRRFYDRLSRTTGLSPESGRRLTFWIRLAADLILWPPVIYGVLLACKISPTLLNAWLVRFFTQIRLGDINLSLIDVGTAILIATIGLLVVGGMKRWVRERVMPNTQLDLGMQNSISTGVGYIGGLIVIMIAIMVLGIDFSSIALVAGALSVGIGFGLRTVVENFVAGLLLLIERPVKAGDWIVVGATEGIVKSISVRSTEIETFDRASVIVPNSALVASPVTNWTHKNRIARVIVKLSVPLGADPRRIESMLLACAREGEHVMKHPAPSVILRAIGEEKLDFELRCFVTDTDYYLPTLSALNFAIDAAMRRERVRPVGTAEISIQPALEELGRRVVEPA